MDGSVQEAVSMLDEILPGGLAAYTVGKGGAREELTVDADYFDIPLVVLVDGNSASAAEVFAGAVQGRERGQIVGTQTYGKGVVQSVIDMPYSGGGVKLTNALYYTPAEKAVNDGITPDIVVSNPEGRLTFETECAAAAGHYGAWRNDRTGVSYMSRIGIIAIIIEGNKESVARVNTVLSDYSELVHARMGVPNHEKNLNVISLVVEATNEQVGALTGRLGNIPDVTVKSMMTNKTY